MTKWGNICYYFRGTETIRKEQRGGSRMSVIQSLQFLSIVLVGWLFVLFQAILALHDGYFTQTQMKELGVTNGYSFFEHGGMWADVFIIVPAVAYITTNYRLAYTSWYSIVIFVVTLIVISAIGYGYSIGEKTLPDVLRPDAYVHNGKTTPAGWVHLSFALAAIYIFVMFYLTPLDPSASQRDITIISLLLTVFFYLGIRKFSPLWEFSNLAKVQFAGSCFALWMVTAIRLLR